MESDMSTKKTRRSYAPEKKAVILRRHLFEKVAISDLCDEYEVQPSVIYGWQQQLSENLELSLQGGKRRKADNKEVALVKEVEGLKSRLAKKDSVIAEISEELVSLKKEVGEP
jgi:transposase